jgi:hypothetical protein
LHRSIFLDAAGLVWPITWGMAEPRYRLLDGLEQLNPIP